MTVLDCKQMMNINVWPEGFHAGGGAERAVGGPMSAADRGGPQWAREGPANGGLLLEPRGRRRLEKSWDQGGKGLTSARSPSSALLPVFGEGSRSKIDYRQKGTFILASLLEDLVCDTSQMED